MKKLNLNESGTRSISWGLVLAVPVPAVFLILARFCGKATIVLNMAARLFLAAGLTVIAVTLVLVAIELRQDARLFARYAAEPNVKIALHSGGYECRSCGNRRVRQDDARCNVCGKAFVS